MERFGLRGKLFAVSAVVIALGAALAYALTWSFLEASIGARLEAEALARADAVAARSAAAGIDPASIAGADGFADEVAAESSCRVTLFDAAGAVTGDSQLAPDELERERTSTRSPEVVAALAGARATSKRFSTVALSDLVFGAVPIRRDGEIRGVARVGLSTAPFAAARARLRAVALGFVLLTLAAAFVLSSLAARFATQGVRSLAIAARRIAGGDLDVRPHRLEGADLADLGRSLEQLAGGLRSTLGELVSERDILSGILTGMREGVLLVDHEGRVALINPALREMLLLRDDVVGRLTIEVVRDASLHDLIDGARRSQAAAQGEIEVGGLRPRKLLVRAEPLGVRPGSLLLVFHDVTDLRRLETMRRDFVANASHELRTPVSSIRSATETLLIMPANDEEARARFLGIVERNAARLQQLIEDLLDLSKIESRDLAIASEAVDVAEIVERVAALLHERAASVKTTIDVDIDPDTPAAVADPRALEQVFYNLLDNAVKYCPGATVTVSARADTRSRAQESGAPTVEITVRDTGPGIEARHLDRIFERFYRVDAGRSRQLGGTGLGLSIVKHLVEAMHGAIEVSSVVGAGTKFTVELPRARLIDRPPTSSPAPSERISERPLA